jgi:hypothetical protein
MFIYFPISPNRTLKIGFRKRQQILKIIVDYYMLLPEEKKSLVIKKPEDPVLII